MNRHEKKDEVQRQAVEAWKVKRRGRLQMCTGSGKSRASLLCALEVGASKVTIIVPTENLRDNNWPNELREWAPNLEYEILCYASAHKVKDKDIEFLILDEVHRLTDLSVKFISQNQIKDIVSLTATFPEDPSKAEMIERLTPLAFNYSLEEGIRDGVVAPFDLVIIDCYLDDKIKNIPGGSKAKPFLTTEYRHYQYLTKMWRVNQFGNNQAAANAWAQKRMRFLYDLPSKTELAKKLIPKLLSGRSLIFCGSINQAESLCEYSFHSKSNENNLAKLKNKEIDQLSCIKKLNEGENIEDMDSCLIVQCNSKELDLIQRIGRVVRWREGHRAKVYIMRVLHTQDETWVNKAIENFNSVQYIHSNNLL